MGLNYWNTHLLATYAKSYPLGETLTFGRQNISIKAKYQEKISKAHNVDVTFFSGFCEPLLGELGSIKVTSMDASAYEGSEIVLDLSKPVPKEYWNTFDTILDYGTAEHIFNYPQVLTNVFRLLKKNGAYNFCLPITGWCDHGLYQFSPNMFTSIAASGYFDLKFLFMQGGGYQRRVYAAEGPLGLRSIELLSSKKIMAWGVLIKNNKAELNENLINIFQIYYLKNWSEINGKTNSEIKKYIENNKVNLGSLNFDNISEALKKNIPEKIKQLLWFYKSYHSLNFIDIQEKFNTYNFKYKLSG